MNKRKIEEIFEIFKEKDSSPKTELDSVNDFTLLIAIVMSAQSTDKGVNKATPELFARYNTPQAIYDLGEEGLREYIKTIGLFNSKAKNIIALSKKLMDEFDGEIPEDASALETLPGVGRKTANVWLNCARGHHTMAVDTHVQRVSNRIGLCKTANPTQTEKALVKKIPDKFMLHAHHWLILHGRYTCVARKPKCEICDIHHLCEFKEKTA